MCAREKQTDREERIRQTRRQKEREKAELPIMSKSVSDVFLTALSCLSFADDSRIYIWDVATRRCEHTFEDEGCIHNDSLAVSPNGSFLAAG